MDISWINKFSGGLDLIPVAIALAGFFLMFRLPKAQTLERKLAHALAGICFVALPIAQISWIFAVIEGVPMLGAMMDSVWTIFNFCSVVALLILLHDRDVA